VSNAGILIPIFGILCGIVAIISSAIIRSQKMKLDMMREERVSGASDTEMLRELQRLKDRVAVLERLATDGDRKLAGEIDRLRRDDTTRP
jgi:hypothetical protein